MGFSTLLDILGSTLIGGFLLMILLRMNDTSVKSNYMYNGEKIVQQNLVEVVNLLEYDLRKIGYCQDWDEIPNPTTAILSANESMIEFKTDVPTTTHPFGDGSVDIIKYYLGDTTELASTPNPKDRILYRVVNNETPKGSNLGITQFKLTFFDAMGDTLDTAGVPPPIGIATMQIDIAVENPAAYADDYSVDRRVIWRQIRLPARNFMLR